VVVVVVGGEDLLGRRGAVISATGRAEQGEMSRCLGGRVGDFG